MKYALTSVLIALVSSFSALAAEVTISKVHLCCPGCVKGVEKAVAEIKDVKVSADEDAETVTLSGANKGSVQKAADALVASGYFGQSSDAQIKLVAKTGAKGSKVQSLKVQGVHLCCGRCVSTVDKAVKSVEGVKAHTAVKNAESFEVTGEFNDKEVFDALQKVGLTGKVATK